MPLSEEEKESNRIESEKLGLISPSHYNLLLYGDRARYLPTYTCYVCETTFPSRNKMFEHLYDLTSHTV